MAPFKLKLLALPFDTQVFTHHLDGGFFNEIGDSEVRSGSVGITLEVTRKSADTFALRLSCKGTLEIPCDRCLDSMTHTVDTDYDLTVRREGAAYDDSRDNVLIVPESWSELDLSEIVRDTVLLTIPIVHCHATGDCNAAMLRRLDEHRADDMPAGDDRGDNDSIDPRWEALRRMKESKDD